MTAEEFYKKLNAELTSDDYFVLSYRILSFLYVWMRDRYRYTSGVSFDGELLGVRSGYLVDVIQNLSDAEYIKYGSLTVDGKEISLSEVRITDKGFVYLTTSKIMYAAKEAHERLLDAELAVEEANRRQAEWEAYRNSPEYKEQERKRKEQAEIYRKKREAQREKEREYGRQYRARKKRNGKLKKKPLKIE